MWCWHRIRESETGLCPACRTPYGDDPHEFSAVDMEEVVKANKEKAAAGKRGKERLRQQQAASAVSGGSLSMSYGGAGGSSGVGGMHIGGGSDGDLALAMAGGSRVHLDPPKDRNQLANMRVIRRNLVYGVGLPPSVATEDTLRKSEYFGQYGKVSKIVLNRNHNGNGDPRRASASAYVTFAHKDDTLACILALDGFYLDGRNIRASYGTSKYCSAFIKNVRCNNPDCTYLHTMGDSEDTFTKQEIQAGYVTSGRDVLARQQQLAAAASSSNSRRRVGSGGPSGSGKVTSNPVFPPPTYDEPNKPSQANLVPAPPSTSSTTQFPPVGSVSVARNSSAGFSSIASGNSTGGKIIRSSSLPPSSGLGANTIASVLSTSSHKAEAVLTPAELLSRQQEQLRKMHPQNNSAVKNGHMASAASVVGGGQKKQGSIPDSLPVSNGVERSSSLSNKRPQSNNLAPATAASVVAGVHSTTRVGQIQTSSHSTLTALTPLKRANSMNEKKESISSIGNTKSVSHVESVQLPPNMPVPKGLTEAEQNAFLMQRKVALLAMRQQQLSAIQNVGNGGNIPSVQPMASGTATSSPTSSISSASGRATNIRSPSSENGIVGAGAIGGTVIGGNLANAGPGPIGIRASIGMGSMGSMENTADAKNNLFLTRNSTAISGSSLSVGGAGLGCCTISGFGSSNSEIRGGNMDRNCLHEWPVGQGLNSGENGSLFGSNPGSRIGGAGLWGNENVERRSDSSSGYSHGESKGNSGVIGGSRLSDKSGLGQPGTQGGDFLSGDPFKGGKESGSSTLASMLGIELPTGVGSLRDSLWASSTPVRAPPGEMSHNIPTPTPIGAGIKANNSVIIGGGANLNGTGGLPIGGYGSPVGNVKGNTSDIALLQSLLPGVHITSGNAYQPAAPNTGRNTSHRGGGWGSMSSMPPSSLSHQQQHNNVQPVGMGGLMHQNIHPQQQQLQQRPNETWGSGALYPGAPNTQHVNESRNPNHSAQSNIW